MAPDAQSALLVGVEFVTLAFLALTGVAVLKAFLLARARPLGLLGVGFALAAVAQLAAIGLELFQDPQVAGDTIDFFDGLFWAYYIALAAGLVLIFASFGRRPFQVAAASGMVLTWAFPINQFLLAALYFLVVLHAGFNHIGRARPGSLQTALGFFLLLLGQFLFMTDISALQPDLFPSNWFYGTAALNPRSLAGEVPSAFGAILLYLAVARPRGRT